jgi:large subunit ribosomal protein L25
VSSEVKIQAEPRTEFGKGAARRIRRQNLVPAVLYGHGADPVHVSVPGHDLMLALKNANALLSIQWDGNTQLALPKAVQRDPIKGFIEHADLLIVARGEKVTVDVPVVLVGEPPADALVTVEHATIPLDAEATHIPQSVEVNIEGLAIGTQILAKDLTLTEGATLRLEPEALVVNIVAAPTAEEIEAELADAEADLGVEHDVPETDEDSADADGTAADDSAGGGDEGPADSSSE